jgi:hypothetical protein
MSAGMPALGAFGPGQNWVNAAQGYAANERDPHVQSQRALDALRKYLTMQGDARVHGAQLGADLYNQNDPLARMFATQTATNSAQSDTANALASASASFEGKNLDWLHQALLELMKPKQKQQTTIGFGPASLSF